MSTTISGTTGIDKVQDGTTINASSIMGALNASGTAPIYACRAWVNFNGTGTVAIRKSGNVSSVTDNGAGDYTINFTVAMIDVNYVLIGSCNGGTVVGSNYTLAGANNSNAENIKNTNNANVTTGYISSISGNSSLIDHPNISIAIFR